MTQEVTTGINCRVIQNKPVKTKHGTLDFRGNAIITLGIIPDPQLICIN